MPPLLPFQHHMAEIRNHFHEGRAFPLTYVRAVLSLGIRYEVEKDTPIEDIIAFYDARGVNYKNMWTELYENAIKDSLECAKWDGNDFEYIVEDKKLHNYCISRQGIVQKGDVVQGIDHVEVQKSDCTALQNYVRPYKEGKLTGTNMKVALRPGCYPEWDGVIWKPFLPLR